MEKHRILIISYLFPPAGGIAVQRALSLAKYSPGCGYEVHVLTANNAAGPIRIFCGRCLAGVTLHGAFTPEILFGVRQMLWRRLSGGGKPQTAKAATVGKRLFSVKGLIAEAVKRVLWSEPEMLWVPFALQRVHHRKEYDIEAIIVTAVPFSSFLLGNALKEQFPDLKLFNYCRDWLSYLFIYLFEFDYQKSDYTRPRAIEIERRTVELR